MSCLPLVLCLMPLLHTVLSYLLAPVNVSVNSSNFHHVLRWDPGPGTPPGTHYKIYRVMGKKKVYLTNSTTTSVGLKLQFPKERHHLTVRAFFNKTRSPFSKTRSFAPYEETVIDPPELSLAGCGNCIQINISLPEGENYDIHSFYRPQYRVLWKKHDEEVPHETFTENRRFTLSNLQEGTEYCIQVEPKITLNKNTKPSTWKCVITSIVEPSRGPAVVGAVAALLVFVFGGIMTAVLCLSYTGFICKMKENLPRAVTAALGRGYTLTPERTTPDQISVSPAVEKQRTPNNPTAPQPVTWGSHSEEEEEEEEEDEGVNVYMNRPAEFSLGQDSSGDSGGSSGSRMAAPASSDSAAFEECDEEEAEDKLMEVCFSPQEVQTGVTGEVVDEKEEEEEEVYEGSDNVNLFSVTLAALAAREEEEEEEDTRDSLKDFLKLSNQEPLVPSESRTEQDDWTLKKSTQEDFTATPQREEEDEEEEEEEEFSGYMRHT